MESRASLPQQGSIREHRLCLSEAGNFGGNRSTSGRRTLLAQSAILPVSSSHNQTRSNHPFKMAGCMKSLLQHCRLIPSASPPRKNLELRPAPLCKPGFVENMAMDSTSPECESQRIIEPKKGDFCNGSR